MNTNYLYNITNTSVVVYKNGKRFLAHDTHPNFKKIIEKIKANSLNGIERLFEVKQTIEKCFNVEIVEGKEVRYKGVALNSGVTKQILSFISEGIPHKPLVKFLDKLMQNPDIEARDTLYNYIGAHYLPITEDGDFVACKAIRGDWMDIYSGKVSNRVGETVYMDRNKVNKSKFECAGSGLHVGSDKYIVGYARDYGKNDYRYIMVKVNPRDVVVVPDEGGFGKIRLCRYKVIREVNREDVSFTSHYAPENKTYKEIRESKPKKGPKRDAKGRFC